MKVAVVHDWLTGMRGGELVLEAILDLFPQAEIYTLLWDQGKLSKKIESRKIHTSPLQAVPGIARRYRYFLPMMPKAIESLDLGDSDLVISSSHCVAKGVRKPKGAVHVSYVHAPMRYIWERYDDYFGPGRAKPWVRAAAQLTRRYLQEWDRASSQAPRVDHLVSNSRFIADQVERAYGRPSSVVHPFVDLSRFREPRKPESFYLMVGAFAPNKRVDLAVEAFTELGLPLRIVGGGQDEAKIRGLAGPTVEFLGMRTNDEIADLFSRCRAFIFPGIEDFGITPLEAMAAGAPVIAYGKGGALETVTDQTGVRYRPQTAQALADAVRQVESGVSFDESACRARAAQFTRARFLSDFASEVRSAWLAAGKSPERLESALSR